MPVRILLAIVALISVDLCASAGVGDKVADVGSMRDLRGSARSLHSFKDHKAIVIVFLGTDCPISNLYVPSLLEMEKKYRDQNVQVIAAYPNENEDLDQISRHAYDRELPFPVLKDVRQKLASAVGAERVPSVAV